MPTSVVDRVIISDGGSTDGTVEAARAAGAAVIATARGYGRACCDGAAAAADCEIVVFLDGDGSDDPEQIPLLTDPISAGLADFVIGARARGLGEPGSMGAHQRLAGLVVGAILRRLYGVRYSDMGPMRAIRRDALRRLGMREMGYGWNLEMQMRAARGGLRILEVPVAHRARAGGVAKVSGSLRGTLRAGWHIVSTLCRVALSAPRRPMTRATARK